METFVRNVAGSGSFPWFGQPGSNVVYAEGASAATLLRKKRGKCVKAQYFQHGFGEIVAVCSSKNTRSVG